MDDRHWLSVVEAFNAVPLDGSWLKALSALSAATGSRSAELIGLGSANSVPFNWVTDLGSDWKEDFIAVGGGDPRVNPFVRAGSQARVLEVRASTEFISREERRRSPFLVEHAVRHDIPHACLTPLIKESGMLIGLAVLRSGSQGEIGSEDRAVFESIAPHVLAAVRTQLALEHHGAELMAGTLEALSLSAFVCDRQGVVRAMTPLAEAMAGEGLPLRLRGGLLGTSCLVETRQLTDAIGLAAGGLGRPGKPVCGTIVVRKDLAGPVVLDVLPVARRREHSFGFEPRVLVVVRGAQPDAGRMRLLVRTAYGLTAAESDVALRLVEGQTPEAIAASRVSTLGTVRVQIRSIYEKMDVHRVSELVSRVNQLR